MARKVVKKSVKKESFDSEKVGMRIRELRGEMTHVIVESIAISILSLLLFIGAPSVFPEMINPYLPSSLKIMQAFVLVPFVFWLVAVLGNMVRYFKILKLQDLLKK